MFISGMIAALMVVSAIAAIALVKWGIAKANKVQRWRRELAKVSAMLHQHKYIKLGELLSYFFSNDLGGAFAFGHFLCKSLREAKDADALFMEWTAEGWVYELPIRLKDPKFLALVQEAVAVQLAKS